MDNIEVFLKFIAASIGSSIGVFIGEVDGFLYTLILFVFIDYITGLLSAAKQKNLASQVGFWGLIKKVMIFVMVGIAYLIDVNVIKGGLVLRSTVIFFYLSNEGLSILENFSEIGVPFPDKLTSVLKQLHSKEDCKEDNKEEQNDNGTDNN